MFDPIITPLFVLCVLFWPDKPINKVPTQQERWEQEARMF